ncbi:unnamed protein product, partial [Tilletia laevis]
MNGVLPVEAPAPAPSPSPTRASAEREKKEDEHTEDGKGPFRRLRIAMISDFFFPNVGGVEGHIYMVSQQLLRRGHKVIVITHAYPPHRTGIRWLPSGLKVYYVPYEVLARQDTLPNFFSLLPLLRQILIRERIELVHGHQALSSMAHEGILYARSLGIRCVFTDHSLFGFADAASIMTNKLLRFVLSDVEHVICVSHTGKENTVLRAALDPKDVSVIPNAVVASDFIPDPSAPRPGRITIVVLSRLMYRKGIDLLIAAIPRICNQHPDVHFLIGGEGPKRIDLEQMREKYLLLDRIELVGAIRPSDARAHLVRGHLFLNTSLTEAFGTSSIEAACAGLFVVSTRVGGVPEVLPSNMIELAEPDEDDVVRATNKGLEYLRSGAHSPQAAHNAIKSFYTWSDVALRLERVYLTHAMHPNIDPPDAWDRLCSYRACGPLAGLVFVLLVAVQNLYLGILRWLHQWACARSYGLGTKLPWDQQFLVESLSDSTIYMAYYTIAHFLQGGVEDGSKGSPMGVQVDDCTDEFFDFIFCGGDWPANSKVPKEKADIMQREFEYFYPIDVRSSGKDLIPNHLTFCIYNHAAIFPEKHWPVSMRINGHLMLNGKKMSKSTGNSLSMQESIEKFGADATRISLADAGDGIEDANFEEETANANILRLHTLIDWSEDIMKN